MDYWLKWYIILRLQHKYWYVRTYMTGDLRVRCKLFHRLGNTPLQEADPIPSRPTRFPSIVYRPAKSSSI